MLHFHCLLLRIDVSTTGLLLIPHSLNIKKTLSLSLLKTQIIMRAMMIDSTRSLFQKPFIDQMLFMMIQEAKRNRISKSIAS